jgi:hypothetical protein
MLLVYDPLSSAKANCPRPRTPVPTGDLRQMKFCEVEEFDFPYVRDCLRDVGIPVLNMDIDPLNASQEQAHTRLQAFAEQLA